VVAQDVVVSRIGIFGLRALLLLPSARVASSGVSYAKLLLLHIQVKALENGRCHGEVSTKQMTATFVLGLFLSHQNRFLTFGTARSIGSHNDWSTRSVLRLFATTVDSTIGLPRTWHGAADSFTRQYNATETVASV
jgi:hypothetical protein